MTPDPSEDPGGRLAPLSPASLSGCAVAGLVLGWLVHPVAVWLGGVAPVVTWSQGAFLWVAAVALAVAARAMRRGVESGGLLDHDRAVNRLVLARASALVGALVGGGYGGYAISWIGDGSQMTGSRVATSLFAALGGVVLVLGGLALERACRTPSDDEDP